jgi:hypothetical protein
LAVEATINVDAGPAGYNTNGLIIFDYQSATDFKFAGAYVGGNKWVVGRKSGLSWLTDSQLLETINVGTDYALRLEINNGVVTLLVDGVSKLSRTYTGSSTDGQIGVGTWKAFAHFDDIVVEPLVAATGVSSQVSGGAIIAQLARQAARARAAGLAAWTEPSTSDEAQPTSERTTVPLSPVAGERTRTVPAISATLVVDAALSDEDYWHELELPLANLFTQ